jgi:ABC-2 type transport system ATP-binding protein
MLRVNLLSKNFGNFNVLKNISINAEKGQIYGLVGSNGCGKTTLLKHIIQVYKQDEGEVFFDDNLITKDSEDIKEFYYVQDDLFFPHGSTLKSLFGYEKLLYKNISKEKFDKLSEYFKVDINKRLSNMSKGQKRQAAFVLAMSANPKVLLLDEIVDGLDAVVRRKFWNVLIKEVIENNIVVIISSHALKELDNICDKVGIMHEGAIIKEEEMETLKENLKRVQFAVEGQFEENIGKTFNIVKSVKIGSVYFATLRGSVEDFRKSLEERYKVLIFDELAINLEEIFITELGGAGYGMEELDS